MYFVTSCSLLEETRFAGNLLCASSPTEEVGGSGKLFRDGATFPEILFVLHFRLLQAGAGAIPNTNL